VSSTGEWQLHLLGAFRLECGAQEIRFQRRKTASLLAYLALQPDRHTRDELAALFWGDYPDSEARRSLRVALSGLRSALGNEIIIVDGDTVQANPTFPLCCDAIAFQSYAARFLAEAPFDVAASFIDLYNGDLLPGFDDEWIPPLRERLRSLYLEALLHTTQQMRSHSDYEHAIELARRVLASEPSNERAHQHLLFCHMALGDRAAALHQYEICRQVLHDDLGVEPLAETSALYRWIKGQPEHEEPGEARITNLPIPLSSFIGREQEMAQIKRLLAQHRLLTLTGPGGSGKTRLALQVATDLVDGYRDGVWFSDLAAHRRACRRRSHRRSGTGSSRARQRQGHRCACYAPAPAHHPPAARQLRARH
jgi:DNA-binding SARP family transcriptional activator